MAEIQAMARRGSIAVRPVSEDLGEFTGVACFPAGWTAYSFPVPARENIRIRLHHSNKAWFRLIMFNRWGGQEPGMLQNLIETGSPEVTYRNLTDETRRVYVIVDDPGWMSSEANPFILRITRSWNPAKKPMDGAPLATGIWAEQPEVPQRSPAPAGSPEPSKG
jgi:hypothetical protein